MPRIGYDARLRQLHALACHQFRDLEFVALAPDGREVWRAGGRWNAGSGFRRYVGPVREPSIWRLNGAQVEAAEALAEWLAAYREGRPRLREIGLTGPRGPGKTVLAVAFGALVAYACPGATVWLISPTFTVRHELDNALRLVLPGEDTETGWLQAGWKERDLVYTLPNGSRFVHKSADQPERLKDGGFAVAIANEFALWRSDTAAMMVGGLRGNGGSGSGVFVPTWNPAVTEKGAFTTEHSEAVTRGDLEGITRIFRLDPSKNEFIERSYTSDIDRLIRSFGRPDIADADARGIERRDGELAFAEFRGWPAERMVRGADGVARAGHVGAPPPLGHVEVTAEVARGAGKRVGCKGALLLYGADFQVHPHCAGLAVRVYRRTSDSKFVYHVVGEVLADKGGDDELAEMIIESAPRFLDGDAGVRDLLVIGDGTGADQNDRHKSNGRTSFDVLREYGLAVVPAQDPISPRTKSESGRNPDVKQSLAQVDDIMRDDRFFVDPSCTWFIQAATKCRVKIHSGRWRMDDIRPGYSHVLDTFRYVAHRIEPARGPQRKQQRVLYQAGPRVERRA